MQLEYGRKVETMRGNMKRSGLGVLAGLMFMAVAGTVGGPYPGASAQSSAARDVPQYELDSSWPPKLPNNWVMGVPTWVAVDKRDHVWVLHRPRTAAPEQRAN